MVINDLMIYQRLYDTYEYNTQYHNIIDDTMYDLMIYSRLYDTYKYNTQYHNIYTDMSYGHHNINIVASYLNHFSFP